MFIHHIMVMSELVKYIEKRYPNVLLILGPSANKDTAENRKKGYRPGQPDLILAELKLEHTALAMWVTSAMMMTKYQTKFLIGLSDKSYKTMVSEDFEYLHLCVDLYMTVNNPLRRDKNQLRLIRCYNRGRVGNDSPYTSEYDWVLHYLVKYVRNKYPHSVLLPGLSGDGQPELIIAEPGRYHKGLAIWIRHTYRCYHFEELNNEQFSFLKSLAVRSYVTVASNSVYDLTFFVDDYMKDGNDYQLPMYPEELCE